MTPEPNNPFKVTGITIVQQANKPREDGSRIVAYFDVEAHGIAILGCYLTKSLENEFRAFVPKLVNDRGGSRCVRFTDRNLKRHLRHAAHQAYLAFGGDQGGLAPEAEASADD